MESVLVATGSRWRRDGRGRSFPAGVAAFDAPQTIGVEAAIALGRGECAGETVLFDDDHYYIGSALAEMLARAGAGVTYVTSRGVVGAWSAYTAEQGRAHRRLLELGVRVEVNALVSGLEAGEAILRGTFGGPERRIACERFVPVTSREPEDGPWQRLVAEGIAAERVGDCMAPGIVAQAVYDGHRAARRLGAGGADPVPVRRERVLVA